MNRYKIHFKKKPEKEWKLIITTNRSIDFTPHIVNNDFKGICYPFAVDTSNQRPFNDLDPHKYFTPQLDLYLYHGEDVVKTERLELNNLNKKLRGQEVKMGNLVIIIYPMKMSAIKTKAYLPNHRQLISKFTGVVDKIGRTKSKKPAIYYTLNPFMNQTPIASRAFYSNLRSNEEFWKYTMDLTKYLFELHGITWDNEVGWASMLCLRNTLIDTYVLETKKDVYTESWYSRRGDCDEANMIHIKYEMFKQCEFTDPDLLEMQKIASDYVCGVTFNKVNAPSLRKFDSTGGGIGHWFVLGVPKADFEERTIGYNNIKKENPRKLPIVLEEPTGFLYPVSINGRDDASKKIVVLKNILGELDRKMKTFSTLGSADKRFYRSIFSIYTNQFIDKGIFGFRVLLRNGKKYTYGVLFDVFMDDFLLDNKEDYKVAFEPMKIPSNDVLLYSKVMAEKLLRVPPLVRKDGVFEKQFVSTEDIDWKIRTIESKLKKLIESDKLQDDFIICSMDDLSKEDSWTKIKEKFHICGYDKKEESYQAFFFVIFVKKK